MYKTKTEIKVPKSRKKLLVLLIIIGLAVCTVVYFVHVQKSNQASQTAAGNNGTSKINLDPPTKQDKQAVEDHKQDIVDSQTNPPTPAPTDQDGKKTVAIYITDASQYDTTVEVRAYTPDAYETGGTCSYNFTKDGVTITKTQTADKDAKTTYCPTLIVPRSEFSSAGNWALTVAYSSATYQGNKQTTVKIQ